MVCLLIQGQQLSVLVGAKSFLLGVDKAVLLLQSEARITRDLVAEAQKEGKGPWGELTVLMVLGFRKEGWLFLRILLVVRENLLLCGCCAR